MNCKSGNSKPPLTLLDVPDSGVVHAYGMPVLKSSNPCTVNQFQPLKGNTKWFSPDRNFTNKIEASRTKPTKKAKASKPDLQMKESFESATTAHPKTRRRRYTKLDIVKTTSSSPHSDNDENKENIRPGSSSHMQAAQSLKPDAKLDYSQRKHFSGKPNRLNFL